MLCVFVFVFLLWCCFFLWAFRHCFFLFVPVPSKGKQRLLHNRQAYDVVIKKHGINAWDSGS